MTTVTTNIVEFIEARLTEDEDAAQQQISIDRRFREDQDIDVTYGWTMRAHDRVSGGRSTSHGDGAPSPDRVLRDVAAKRLIIDEYKREQWVISQGHTTEWTEGGQGARETVIRALAGIYSDHPDFQQEWSL